MSKPISNIALIGSTGSVGMNALEIARTRKDLVRIVGLAAHSNAETFLSQIEEFRPEIAVLIDETAAESIRSRIPQGVTLLAGQASMKKLTQWKSVSLVLAASSGSSALEPVLAALDAGKNIGLANKEIMVMAGHLLQKKAQDHGGHILPVDSEHNAIFQCLQGSRGAQELRKIILTGSGGPMRDFPRERFAEVTPAMAINHPRWSMGKKISVDSATMMNKGLEILEAGWLFDLGTDRIEVVVHPEAIVHSMVEFIDGSIIAQLGPTDMKLPLIHVMAYPERFPAPELRTNLAEIGALHFMKPDLAKFECLRLAIEVANQRETTAPCVMNAANEVAVHAFLEEKIAFDLIPVVIEQTLKSHQPTAAPDFGTVISIDQWARQTAQKHCEAVARPVKKKDPTWA